MRKCFDIVVLGLLLAIAACAAAGMTISDAKQSADNSSISLTGKVITYASTDSFYIEEDNRSTGIMVQMTAHGLTVGMRADVSGTVKTNTSRERYIQASGAVQTAAPNSAGTISPVGMNNNALGGTDWQVVGAGGQKGTSNSIGLNNIGLLVNTWGAYQQVNATTFTVDDGAGLNIQCTVPTGTFLYSGWQYVAVTGISSIYKFNSSIYPPNILVSDIDVVSPVEAVSVPGTPIGNTGTAENVSTTYSTTGATDNWGQTVEYSFDWGDGTSSPWSTSTSASHAWSTAGTVAVMVTARSQAHPNVATVSTGLPVNVVSSPYPGTMIYIPAGSFLMGNSGVGDDATLGYSDEFPQHSVTLAAYYIGEYDVTRGEYAQFIIAGGYSTQSYWSSAGWSWKVSNNATQPQYWAAVQNWGTGNFTQTDSYPVVGVTYYEAEAFCNWAGGHLPTEAQWEMAARWTGSHPNIYPWGDTWDPEKCNNYYDHNAAGGGYEAEQMSPVGSYPSGASPCGCQDMAGNAWQWVQDWYVSYPGSTSPFDFTGSYRVFRGGSFLSNGSYATVRCACRSASGLEAGPSGYSVNIGFRLAR